MCCSAGEIDRDWPAHPWRWPLTVFGLCAVLTCRVPAAWGEDTVLVSRSEGPGETRRSGRVLDFTGEWLTLELAGGRQEQIPTARVRGVETVQVPDRQSADRRFREGRFADAVVGYRKAVEDESRTWVRREILAQLARCYRNMDQYVRAGDTFLIILRSDPTTQWYDALPLAWKPRQFDTQAIDRAKGWISDTKVPAAALMGASWLLSTPDRADGVKTLQELAADADPRISQLARAQLWRTELVTATQAQVEAWEKTIQQMDEPLRAGPYYLLGLGLARHAQHARAALALLRGPILYPDDRDLAAESLWAAGEELEKAGDHPGAVTVYRELIDKYPGHPLVPSAEQRISPTTSR